MRDKVTVFRDVLKNGYNIRHRLSALQQEHSDESTGKKIGLCWIVAEKDICKWEFQNVGKVNNFMEQSSS
jgi:hypothetical protein